jgi:hypothetical protein
VEAVVALLVGLLVVQLGLSTLARLRAAQRELAARTDELVALRVGRHVLRRELRYGVPDRDWMAAGDSLSLRAFRGTALVCASDSLAAEIVVAYVGDRAPDPSKDSLLLVTEEGVAHVYALAGVGAPSAPCAGPRGATAMRWRLDRAAPPAAAVARLFERGSYHLGDAALRYRRGASGRQPLTPDVWSAGSGWDVSDGRLGMHVVPSRPGAAPWTGWIGSRVPE